MIFRDVSQLHVAGIWLPIPAGTRNILFEIFLRKSCWSGTECEIAESHV